MCARSRSDHLLLVVVTWDGNNYDIPAVSHVRGAQWEADMRAYDNGCLYTVTVSAAEVHAFNQTWPCSSLPERSIWFQFDKRNGDIVDLHPYSIDGPEVVALSQDAQAYGRKRLKLEF